MDLNAVGNLLKPLAPVVEEAYKDGIKPWLQPLGRAAGVLTRAVEVAVQPVEAWVANKEAAQAQILSAIADRTLHIPPENLIPPRPMVAQPAIEGMALTLEEPELFNQFANLLANAMDNRQADRVHPSFSVLLKQLSSNEAQLVEWLFSFCQKHTIISISCISLRFFNNRENEHRYDIIIPFYLGEGPHKIFNNNHQIVAASLHNLERLGLLHLPEPSPHYTHHNFPPLEEESIFQERLDDLKKRDPSIYGREEIGRGCVQLTQFGILFFNACLIPPKGQAE